MYFIIITDFLEIPLTIRIPRTHLQARYWKQKKGNQILLASVYSIIAQKLDIPIYGVNLPQHFILAYLDEERESVIDNNVLFYINAFNKGFIFGKRDVDAFLKQLKITPDERFYEPCSNTDIIKRVLRNLVSAYENAGSIEKVAEIEDLLSIFESHLP